MAIKLEEIIQCCDQWLQPSDFNDYAPNGLQVQGSSDVRVIVTGVTASQALIDRAIELDADMLLVHHGYFWRGENPTLTGIKYRRIKSLIDNNMSLVGFHLPLDAQPEFGNNIELAARLGIAVEGGVAGTGNPAIALQGCFDEVLTGAQVAAKIEAAVARKPLHIDATRAIKRVAWCTGGGQGYIEPAVAAGVDAFITGEVSEQTVHIAREYGIHFFSAGHHATERYGIKALGEKLQQKYALEVHFVDIDNPA